MRESWGSREERRWDERLWDETDGRHFHASMYKQGITTVKFMHQIKIKQWIKQMDGEGWGWGRRMVERRGGRGQMEWHHAGRHSQAQARSIIGHQCERNAKLQENSPTPLTTATQRKGKGIFPSECRWSVQGSQGIIYGAKKSWGYWRMMCMGTRLPPLASLHGMPTILFSSLLCAVGHNTGRRRKRDRPHLPGTYLIITHLIQGRRNAE